MKKANKWVGLGIIAVIALVQGVGFGQAFMLLDARFIDQYPAFSNFLVGAGLALGLAIEAGIAYAAAMYPSMKGKKEIRLTQTALCSLLAIAPLVLTPVRMYSMDAGMKASQWIGVSLGVAFLLSLSPSLVTIMVAVVNRDALLVKNPDAQQSGRSATSASAVRTQSGRSATSAGAVRTQSGRSATSASAVRAQSGRSATSAGAVRTQSEQSATSASEWPRKCDHCAELISSPNAKGGHMKKHHPDLCVRKAIPIEAMK